MKDSRNREIDYMRISITDRCNLRCRYCMPECGVEPVPMDEILSYEEITGICRESVKLGIRKFRITGGEPLVRKNAPELVGMIKNLEGVEEVHLTTNGILLKDYMDDLIRNGIDGVNISLDTVDRDRYREITGSDGIDRVFEGLHEALGRGLPVKINSVLLDEESFIGMIELARNLKVCIRFIELMPIGNARYSPAVSFEKVDKYIRENIGIPQEDPKIHGNGPARYFRLDGFEGSLGFISPIHQKFCGSCNRIRLTSTGQIKPCLCYGDLFDVKAPLRAGDMDAVRNILATGISAKPGAHCFHDPEQVSERLKMVSIGG